MFYKQFSKISNIGQQIRVLSYCDFGKKKRLWKLAISVEKIRIIPYGSNCPIRIWETKKLEFTSNFIFELLFHPYIQFLKVSYIGSRFFHMGQIQILGFSEHKTSDSLQIWYLDMYTTSTHNFRKWAISVHRNRVLLYV